MGMIDQARLQGSLSEQQLKQQVRKGLSFAPFFTKPNLHPYDEIVFEKRTSVIAEPDGRVVFEMKDVEVPSSWTQLATDIIASKYFRKRGVPEIGRETSAKQVCYRIANTIRHFGEHHHYFADKASAEMFELELISILINQRGAFNSPVWFNCGLFHHYGISGGTGNWYWNFDGNEVEMLSNNYERPQCSACFIQAVEDDLMGIYELVKAEARLFKYGSGTGSNFSKIRGRQEKLSGGGTSSGLMSFLEVFDRAAGATKSGGTTRRAAKMVCLDLDHPEIMDFITWKSKEEKKARALIAAGYPADFNGDAYKTISGQNSNNSVRITDSFMNAVLENTKWKTTMRTTGAVVDEFNARDLMNQVCQAAWDCADPGVQFDTIINEWHTCPNTDKIHASNPCVTGDTKVLTKEGRWIPIQDFVDRPVTLLTNTGVIQEAPISGSFKTGKKPVYQLTTKSGYELKVTADHKIFTVNRGFVEAVQLTKDDFVLLPAHEISQIEDPQDPTFYQMVGVYLGDGSGRNVSVNNGIQLTMSKETEMPVLETFATYVASNFERATHKQSPATVQIAKTSGKYVITHQQVIEKFKELVDLNLYSHEKCISQQIFSLPLGAQKYVLQGLFTADGTVANYGEKSQYVALDSTSLQMLKDVQILLLGFGIKSKLYANRRAGKETALLPDGKGGLKEYAVREVHSLRISRSSRKRFEEFIGFMSESPKNEKLKFLNEQVETYQDLPLDAVLSLDYLGVQEVYDLTEPLTHTFVANGITIHNCSEYMFLDNSACNLASINLMKYVDEEGNFQIDAFKYTVRVFITAMEILVDFSSYPTKPIAQNSHDYRPLGLGYANLGTLLMVNGIAYDSEKARAIGGAITAIMCGDAYATSAELASLIGPFNGFEKNREPMLRVMNKHRDAAYKIDVRYCPEDLLHAARESWDGAVHLGEKYGYRNSQTTVIAPTGTIGLLMDCDTTGVEPEFSLVKWKKLAGGGYFKIVNNSIERALKKLGYTPTQRQDIINYILGHGSLENASHINKDALKKLGYTDDQIKEAEAYVLKMKSLDEWTPHIHAKALAQKGLSPQQIQEALVYVGGSQTIEGAPHIKEEHYDIFDCANKCGFGERFIEPMGHVKMMAAVQPFISGAISKTVNIPNESTVKDIEQIYIEAWKLGLKAVALYRDGCKLSQPLHSKTQGKELSAESKVSGEQAQQELVLPPVRTGLTVETNIAGHPVAFRTSNFTQGSPAELTIEMHKQGSAYNSMMTAFAKAVTIGLRKGVPLDEYVETFTFTRFEPNGMTSHPNVKTCTSVLDFVFRVLGMEYLGKTDIVHVQPTHQLQKDTQKDAGSLKTGEIKADARQELAQVAADASTNNALSNQLSKMMGDAPACNTCGNITVRSGSCYKCLSCGNSLGCS